MAGQIPKNSVWSAMNYTPPRGKCNHKVSMLSPVCPCLRFMLHPIKAATSFECDGCAHHASFHSMENPAENAVLEKWAQQEASEREAQAGAGTSKKRKLITQGVATAAENDSTLADLLSGSSTAGSSKTKAKRKTKASGAASSTSIDLGND